MPKPKVPKGYEQSHLHCRTFGHTWHLGEGAPDGYGFYRFVLLCETCHTRRIDTVNRRTGAVVPGSRRYEYQPGYQAKEHESLRRTVYRVEFIRRIEQ
jgi:hypothetical protein